jgi:L-amino acid N-acyltransferase YncA
MIKKFLNLIKYKKFKELFYLIQANIQSNLVSFNNFYITKCTEINHNLPVKELDHNYTFIKESPTTEKISEISKYLDIDVKAINLQLNNEFEKTLIAGIKHNNRYIALTYFKPSNKFIAGSGYSTYLDNEQKTYYYVFGTYIHQDHRMKGLFVYLSKKIFDLSKDKGMGGLFGVIHFLNEPSIKAHKRFGFKVHKNVHYLKILCFEWLWEGKKIF